MERTLLSLPPLDCLIGGFQPGRLYALCAAENASPAPLALTLAHRLAVEAGVPVVYLCAAASRAWLLREIAWEDVEVSSPYHLRAARTPSEEQQICERIQANRQQPLYPLVLEEISPGTLEDALHSLPQPPRLVIVDGDVWHPDTAPDALRRLAAALRVPVLLLVSLEPSVEGGPHLADIPEALALCADVLLAIGNPRFGEEQDEEAIPDSFYNPVTLLGAQPAATVLLRFDLTTNRFAREG